MDTLERKIHALETQRLALLAGDLSPHDVDTVMAINSIVADLRRALFS